MEKMIPTITNAKCRGHRQKIFVIGFNKTGTCSFHHFFRANHLKSQHAKKWNPTSYDCFSDNGQLNNFKKLAVEHPNSVFILNTRALDEWVISRFRHGARFKKAWAYPPSAMKCVNWIQDREQHHKKILEYFVNAPARIFIVNIDQPNWLNYVANMLGLSPVPLVDEKKNVSPPDESAEIREQIETAAALAFQMAQYSESERKNILLRNPVLTRRYLQIYPNNILT
jgi:hypothetical protein